jgi:hypothetical protein
MPPQVKERLNLALLYAGSFLTTVSRYRQFSEKIHRPPGVPVECALAHVEDARVAPFSLASNQPVANPVANQAG